MTDAELKRRSREMVEDCFTKGLYKTLIEVTIIGGFVTIGCIALVMWVWDSLIKPMVEKGWIN